MRKRLRVGAVLCALLSPSLAAADSEADAGVVSPFALGLPDRPWRLLVELPGFEMVPVLQRKGSARALGALERSGLTVSLTVAESPGDPSARSCRDHDWAGRQKAAPLAREDTRLTATGDQARVEFLLPADGEAGPEKHVLLYLQRDGVCAIVHLWKPHYTLKDAGEMERLLASVRLGS
jgi:hypothetical protein